MTNHQENARPAFYTVKEAAQILRVGASTLYRVIREGDFPAVRLRSRYVVPAAVMDRLLQEATESGGLVDPSRMAAERRTAREVSRLSGGAW
jgi:excisionase family DNA binding protein